MYPFFRPLLVGAFSVLGSGGQLKSERRSSQQQVASDPPLALEPYLPGDHRKPAPRPVKSPLFRTLISSPPAALFFNAPETRSLNLRGKSLEAEDVNNLLADALTDKQGLHSLNLSCNGLSDEAAPFMANFLRMDSKLRYLRFAYNELHGSGIKVLAEAMCENNTLESLDLSSCSIDLPAARALRNMLETNHSLQSLTLELSFFDEHAVWEIAKGLQSNTSLLSLDLGLCGVNDTGLYYLLSAMHVNKTLQTLELGAAAKLNPALMAELDSLLQRNQRLLMGSDCTAPSSRLC